MAVTLLRHKTPLCLLAPSVWPSCLSSAVKSPLSTTPPKWATRLTSTEISGLLRRREMSVEQACAPPIKSFDFNTLAANTPSEDSYAEAVLIDPDIDDSKKCDEIKETNSGDKSSDRRNELTRHSSGGHGMLFGVFDGHGGPACGQVLAKRLLQYIAALLLHPDHLRSHLKALLSSMKSESQLKDEKNRKVRHEFPSSLVRPLNEQYELVAELRSLYEKSYVGLVKSIIDKERTQEDDDNNEYNDESHNDGRVEEMLREAFVRLDNDLSREAQTSESGLREKTASVAMSGAVATVVHISGVDLHVAYAGDATAVLGSLSENDTWVATKLTSEHNCDNQQEVERIVKAHPDEHPRDLLAGDRLLGVLAPLRAFGDFRFKWPSDLIRTLFGSSMGADTVSTHYLSPPYLTAEPQITRHKLSARDKFLVLGSDGLWDLMTPMQVIRLVGEHMSGKVTLSPLQLDGHKDELYLKDINSLLRSRKEAMKLKPVDSNAATHLIRNALGGSAYGVDNSRLSQMLTLPSSMVRMFRDDITVMVIYFDGDYLRNY